MNSLGSSLYSIYWNLAGSSLYRTLRVVQTYSHILIKVCIGWPSATTTPSSTYMSRFLFRYNLYSTQSSSMPDVSQASQRRSVNDNNERINPEASRNDRRGSERSRANSHRDVSQRSRSRGRRRRVSRQDENSVRRSSRRQPRRSRSRQRSADYNNSRRRHQQSVPPSRRRNNRNDRSRDIVSRSQPEGRDRNRGRQRTPSYRRSRNRDGRGHDRKRSRHRRASSHNPFTASQSRGRNIRINKPEDPRTQYRFPTDPNDSFTKAMSSIACNAEFQAKGTFSHIAKGGMTILETNYPRL